MVAAAALSMTIGAAWALDETKYPDLERVWLQRKQQSCRHRQRELFSERGRLPDAGKEGSAAAGYEIFRSDAKV